MDPIKAFQAERAEHIDALKRDEALQRASLAWITETSRHKYVYNFSWLGRPVIQFPQDIIAMQEITWDTRPDLIIETGIAHGGSLIFFASMLKLLGDAGHVLGIDIDIRAHNRQEIEGHRLARRITMIEGSSVDPNVIDQVGAIAASHERIMVVLDSDHTHDHVLAELNAYGPLVTPGCYLVVFDTIIEDVPAGSFPDRPWDKGDNPKTAVHAYLQTTDRFVIDTDIAAKLQITSAPDGYLRCVSD
jgi:cephalosporin hydroxylase